MFWRDLVQMNPFEDANVQFCMQSIPLNGEPIPSQVTAIIHSQVTFVVMETTINT